MGTSDIFLMTFALLVTIVSKVFMDSALSDLPSGKIHFSHTSVFSSFSTMQWIFSNLQEGVHGCLWVCPPYRAPSFKVCISQCAGAHLICQLKVWPHLFSQADDQRTQGYWDSSTFTSDRFKWEKRYWQDLSIRLSLESTCSAGDPGSIPGSGRSPWEGNGYALQYSCLENPINRGA